jgi:hypothetical protein
VPRSSRIKGGKKELNFGKFSVWSGQVRYPDRTSPLDFSLGTFDYYFGRNLLTVSPIDLILLPLLRNFVGIMFLLLESAFISF